MKRVTIYDVANEANVSLATVSRVINGLEIVREDTRQRVEDAIDKLGYKPNAIAQGLALQKTTTIALVVPEAGFNYTGLIINGLLDVAKIYKYSIMLHTTTKGINEINDIVDNIIKSRVDGVVIYNDQIFGDELNQLNRYQFPIVVIGNKMHAESLSSVYVDLQKAMYECAREALAKNGATRIGVLEDRKNPYTTQTLLKGVDQAYRELGKANASYITIPSDYRSTYEFLSKNIASIDYDFLITNRDSQAIAVLNAAAEHGIDVPNDLQVVCAIDSKYNAMFRPRISSFAVPSYDMGAVAMRIMTKMLHDEVVNESEIELSYLFTPRQSTK